MLILIVIFSSCVSKKKIVYFNFDEIDQVKVSNSYRTVFKPDDLLQITVSALDIESVRPFNLPAVTFGSITNSVVGTPQQQNYLIDNDGNIDFPVLGKINVGGLSRNEAIRLLKNKLIPEHLKKVTINIRIANFKVTIAGDVNNPGVYNIPNERITLMEALGLAGDLRISAQRDNVLVIREVNGKKEQFRVDLTSNKTFTSPVYYLQQNDYVYVEPNYATSQSASSNSNTGLFISIAGILLSVLTFFK